MSLFEIPEDPDYHRKLAERIDARVHDLIHTFGFDDIEASVGRWKIEHGGPIHPHRHGMRTHGPARRKARRCQTSAGSRRSPTPGICCREFFVSGEKGLTDYQATAIVVGIAAEVTKFEGCHRRCSDLRAAGYIDDTGREDDQRIVWAITPAGALAFSKMRRDGWTRGPVMNDDLLGDTPDVEGLQ